MHHHLPWFTRQHIDTCNRTYFLISGWSLFVFLCYKATGIVIENKVYNPFEILGIGAVSPSFVDRVLDSLTST